MSIRVLLFSLPVTINNRLNKYADSGDMSEQFIMTITLLGLLYLVVGAISLMGLKTWRLFQYLLFVLTCVLTFVMATSYSITFPHFYWSPFFFAVLVVLIMEVVRCKTNFVI